jgi:hypothetical protein
MSVKQSVEWELAGETEVLGENLLQRHFVHHKSHMIWPRTRTRTAAVGSRRLTAWAMSRHWNYLSQKSISDNEWSLRLTLWHHCALRFVQLSLSAIKSLPCKAQVAHTWPMGYCLAVSWSRDSGVGDFPDIYSHVGPILSGSLTQLNSPIPTLLEQFIQGTIFFLRARIRTKGRKLIASSRADP